MKLPYSSEISDKMINTSTSSRKITESAYHQTPMKHFLLGGKYMLANYPDEEELQRLLEKETQSHCGIFRQRGPYKN